MTEWPCDFKYFESHRCNYHKDWLSMKAERRTLVQQPHDCCIPWKPLMILGVVHLKNRVMPSGSSWFLEIRQFCQIWLPTLGSHIIGKMSKNPLISKTKMAVLVLIYSLYAQFLEQSSRLPCPFLIISGLFINHSYK